MRLLPFLLAGPHILGVGGIPPDSLPVIVGGAGNPARYRRFVVVDNGKVEKSAGSIGNTGSNSRASCSPQVQNFEPPRKTKSAAEKI